MDAKDAYILVKNKYDFLDIRRCFEYDSRFVFETVPKNTRPKTGDALMGGLIAVIKSTGQIRDFKPFHIPIEEYKNAKQVIGFKGSNND